MVWFAVVVAGFGLVVAVRAGGALRRTRQEEQQTAGSQSVRDLLQICVLLPRSLFQHRVCRQSAFQDLKAAFKFAGVEVGGSESAKVFAPTRPPWQIPWLSRFPIFAVSFCRT